MAEQTMTQVDYNRRHALYVCEIRRVEQHYAALKSAVEPGSDMEEVLDEQEEAALGEVRKQFIKDTAATIIRGY